MGMEEDSMRAMGLDVGTKTIGVAMSDPMYMIAQAKETIKRKDLKTDLDRVEELVVEFEVEEIIIGLPKHMNNSIGASAQRAKSFGKELEKRLNKTVIYQDERLSTMSAERILIETGVRRENRKEHVDAVAATFILQPWLDKSRRNL